MAKTEQDISNDSQLDVSVSLEKARPWTRLCSYKA